MLLLRGECKKQKKPPRIVVKARKTQNHQSSKQLNLQDQKVNLELKLHEFKLMMKQLAYLLPILKY